MELYFTVPIDRLALRLPLRKTLSKNGGLNSVHHGGYGLSRAMAAR